MIIAIRRWLKSGGFQVVLWGILIVMAIVFLMPNVPQLGGKTAKWIATINGQELMDDTLQRKSVAFEEQIQQARRQWGQYAANLFKMMGIKLNPREMAFEQMIQEALVDQAAQKVRIELHPDYIGEKLRDPAFLQSISDLIPLYTLDATGINEQALNVHLQRSGLTSSDFNQELSNSIKRTMIMEMATTAEYVPSFELADQTINEYAQKKFSFIPIAIDKLYKEEKQKEVSKEDLKRYFDKANATKKRFLVPEKHGGFIWKFEPSDYNVTITNEEIEEYYNAHKVRQYADKPAEVQVRRILFTISHESQLPTILEKARSVREELAKNPDLFEQQAKELSEDLETAQQGGLLPAFKRGTHNIEFEKAAFLLKEDNDISNAVQTDKGVEIVQRVSKKAPTFKPLSSVASEIRTKLKLRTFKDLFLQDMKELIEEGEVGQEALEAFIKKRGGNAEKIEAMAKDKSKLGQKLFRLSKDGVGFYIDGAIGVAVQLTDIQPAHTPALQTIENNVKESLYQDQALEQLNKLLKDLRSKVGTISMDELAQSVGAAVQKTDWIDKKDTEKLDALRNKAIPIDAMIDLEKVGSIATYEDEENGYLIRLDEIKPLDKELIEEKKDEVKEILLKNQLNLIGRGLVASLYRNAIIKTSEILPFSIEDNAV